MSNVSYFEKLKDPRWQRKRLEALEHNGFECELCCDDKSSLHVHHKTYFKGYEPWEYEIGQLSVLCESCHENAHSELDYLKIITSFLPLDGPCNKDEVARILLCIIYESNPRLAELIINSLDKRYKSFFAALKQSCIEVV